MGKAFQQARLSAFRSINIIESCTQQSKMFQQCCPSFLINKITTLLHYFRGLYFPQASILPSVYFPVSSTSKGCCQQLLWQQTEAEVVSTGKLNHSRSCYSPLHFGDGPLTRPSHKYRTMEKGHSPIHPQVSTETSHSSYSLLSGCF